jgi:hypothetical protein
VQLVASGELDPSRADLYRLYAVVATDRLPPGLRAAPSDGQAQRAGSASGDSAVSSHRCGTPVLRGVKHRLAAMNNGDRAEAEALLAPAPRAALRAVVSPATGKTGETVLPNFVVTRNFTLEWGPALTNEDGSLPLRDLDANGIPDVVERWAELFEASYDAVAEVLKPGAPASVYAGTPLAARLVPVYLGNSSASETIENISSGTYAFTQDTDPVPYVVVNNDLRFVPPNDEGATTAARIRGAMKITAAHEFFHVLHFVYEPPAWVPSADDWWLETSATWMEDEVFGGVNDYHQYYRGASPWTSFVERGLPVSFGGADYVSRAYGGAIFAKYLSEHVGGRAMMGEIWDLIRPTPAPARRILDALDAYAVARGFEGLGELFLGFAGANAVMDYEEGAAYGLVPVRKFSLTADSAVDALPVPRYLGATYLLREAGGGGITVTLTGVPSAPWGLTLVADRGEGYSQVLAGTGAGGSVGLSLARLEPQDLLYAVASFLAPTGSPASYVTQETPVPSGGSIAPGPPPQVDVTPARGGFDASWGFAPEPGVAGHVVRWRAAGAASFAGSRTVVTPVDSVEVRGLGAGSYDVEVFAYDAVGTRGPPPAVPVRVIVAEAGGDAPIPPADAVIQEVVLAPSGSGGGGGGCFVDSLLR